MVGDRRYDDGFFFLDFDLVRKPIGIGHVSIDQFFDQPLHLALDDLLGIVAHRIRLGSHGSICRGFGLRACLPVTPTIRAIAARSHEADVPEMQLATCCIGARLFLSSLRLRRRYECRCSMR